MNKNFNFSLENVYLIRKNAVTSRITMKTMPAYRNTRKCLYFSKSELLLVSAIDLSVNKSAYLSVHLNRTSSGIEMMSSIDKSGFGGGCRLNTGGGGSFIIFV